MASANRADWVLFAEALNGAIWDKDIRRDIHCNVKWCSGEMYWYGRAISFFMKRLLFILLVAEFEV